MTLRSDRDFSNVDCAEARAMAQEALLIAGQSEVPQTARNHAAVCVRCRSTIDEMSRAEGLMAAAFRAARGRIPAPPGELVEEIVSSVGSLAPAAGLLRRIRRSVSRMLWLSLLFLSFLPLCWLAWWVLRALIDLNGR